MVCVGSIQAVDVEAVAVTVKELVSYALTLNPNNQSWLITQADIYFGEELQHIHPETLTEHRVKPVADGLNPPRLSL